MIRVGIVGAAGYTGGELVRLLAVHPEVRLTALVSRSEAGRCLSEVLPHLQGVELPPLEGFDADLLARNCDLVFLAQETGFAMQQVPMLLAKGLKVIDLAADFRLKDAALFEEWYGQPHQAPELLQEALYGLPELVPSEAYRSARLIANPGCYPTLAALALAPMVAEEWIETDGIIMDAKSGVSGAGRARVAVEYLFTELDANFKAYNVARHRHTPEIEQALSANLPDPTRASVKVRFTPHLVPMTRGILSTAYARLRHPVKEEALYELYRRFYAHAPFVVVRPPGQFPTTKQVYGSNRCDLGLAVDDRTGYVVVIGVLDNLIKGAAGQAVQNLNRLYGFDETAGLPLIGVYP